MVASKQHFQIVSSTSSTLWGYTFHPVNTLIGRPNLQDTETGLILGAWRRKIHRSFRASMNSCHHHILIQLQSLCQGEAVVTVVKGRGSSSSSSDLFCGFWSLESFLPTQKRRSLANGLSYVELERHGLDP